MSGGIVTQAFDYLVQGGTGNLEQLLRFVVDTLLRHGFGFEAPAAIPSFGVLGKPARDPARLRIGIVFYRAHVLTGNTLFVTPLCDAIGARGANAVPVYCYSLRDGSHYGESAVAAVLRSYCVDAVVTTVLAAGSFAPGDEFAPGMVAEGWGEQVLGALGVPILQAIASTGSPRASLSPQRETM